MAHIFNTDRPTLRKAEIHSSARHGKCLVLKDKYSAGEEKSPYFLFHGETALRKILKFQGETPNFSEKFQGEIAVSHRKIGAL